MRMRLAVFPSDHAEVLLRPVVEVTLELQLQYLTLTEGGVGSGDQLHGFGPEGRRDLGGTRQQEVAGQDRHRVRPVLVHRHRAAPGVCLVDYVVVVEGAEVDQFDCYAGLHRRRPVLGAELCSDLSQQRAKSLPSCTEEVLRRPGEEADLGDRDLCQTRFDVVEAVPNARDRHEVAQHRQVRHGRRIPIAAVRQTGGTRHGHNRGATIVLLHVGAQSAETRRQICVATWRQPGL